MNSNPGQEAEKTGRVIKRYSNRKLYDTLDSRYITLDEIATLVRSGEEVQILDNRNGRDITEITLAQILLAEQKKSPRRMPLELLRNLLRTGGETISDLVQKKITEPVQQLRDQAERRVDALVRRGEQRMEESLRALREQFGSIQQLVEQLHNLAGWQAFREGGGWRARLAEQLAALRRQLQELEERLLHSKEKS
jgi:polyhydroxyalkanoate synthesis repressor PhaR